MKKELSLYVHIPYCNSKCEYCNFVSTVSTDSEKLKYVELLKREIVLRANEYNKLYTISTIYIGGGTPSCLPLGSIKDIFQTIYKYFTVKNSAEITMELNPNSVTEEKITEYINSGVNRFSIGLQCVDQHVLLSMGRTHTVDDFDNTISLIRSQGISNISADIMLGYPGQKLKAVQETIDHLVSLNIPHISSYMLSVESGTPLQLMVDKGVKYLPKENDTIKMYQTVLKTLTNAGYNRYEISNFAKPGFICKHNKVYWNRSDYLGLGVAAHSYVAGVRFANTEDIKAYFDCIIGKNKVPVAEANKISKEEMKEEFVMLSLRTADGLDTTAYQKEFGESFLAKNKDKLANFIKGGFLVIDSQGRVKATDSGFLVLNKLILELCS